MPHVVRIERPPEGAIPARLACPPLYKVGPTDQMLALGAMLGRLGLMHTALRIEPSGHKLPEGLPRAYLPNPRKLLDRLLGMNNSIDAVTKRIIREVNTQWQCGDLGTGQSTFSRLHQQGWEKLQTTFPGDYLVLHECAFSPCLCFGSGSELYNLPVQSALDVMCRKGFTPGSFLDFLLIAVQYPQLRNLAIPSCHMVMAGTEWPAHKEEPRRFGCVHSAGGRLEFGLGPDSAVPSAQDIHVVLRLT